MKARHWYHCTHVFRGIRWVAERVTPSCIGDGEPLTPRLCVAPSVAACFAARLFTHQVCVYRTEAPRRAVAPRGVWDSTITGERWLVPPVPMVLTHILPEPVVIRACTTIRQYIETTGMSPTPLLRLRSFLEAIEVLGEQGDEFIDRREEAFVRKAICCLSGMNIPRGAVEARSA